jgi:hypothetical protein
MNQYEQPAHPMRITTSSEGYWFSHVVFAVQVDGKGLNYLTNSGLFYSHIEIAFAETLIAGEWLRLSTTTRHKAPQ